MNSQVLVGSIPPPEGITVDFSLTRTTVQQKFIVVYSATFALAVLLVILRIYTRLFIVRSLGFDDYSVIASVVFSAAFFGLCVESMKYGFGRHIWNIPETAMPKYLKLLIPIVITYCWAPFMTKLSILLIYGRPPEYDKKFFSYVLTILDLSHRFHRLNPSKNFRYCIYAIIFIATGYTLATTLATAGGCNPLYTDRTPCINNLALWQAILNIITDFLMMMLPIPLLWSLQLPILQKIGLGFIFTLGSTVVVTSIIRITYIMEILHQPDFTWSEATVCVWSAIELNFGIMCNCLAVLKPFVRRHFPLLVPSSGKNGRESSGRGWEYGSRRKNRTGSYPLASLDNVSYPDGGYSHPAKTSNGNAIIVTNDYGIDTRIAGGDDAESVRNFISSDAVSNGYQSR